MFIAKIKSIVIASSFLISALAVSTPASARDTGPQVRVGGSITIGHVERHKSRNQRRHDNFFDDEFDFRARHRCSPRKAIRKARRKGLRRARVVRVNRRGVIIKGRHRGEAVVIGFNRDRRCSVRFARYR